MNTRQALLATVVALVAAAPAPAQGAAPFYIDSFVSPTGGDPAMPIDPAIAADGTLYAVDYATYPTYVTDRIVRFTSTSAATVVYQGTEADPLDLRRLVVDSAKALYVTDWRTAGNHRLSRIVEGQLPVTSWGQPTDSPLYLGGIARSPSDGRVYMGLSTSSSVARVAILDSSGQQIKAFDVGAGSVSTRGAALDSAGNLYLATDLGYVRVFDHEGTFLRNIGDTGPLDERLNVPLDVAIGPDDNVYVVDRNAVRVYTTTGTFVTSWGGKGSAPGSFDNPSGIDIDAHGNIFVADGSNRRIQQFNFTQPTGGGGGGGDNGGGGQNPPPAAIDGTVQGTVTSNAGPVAGAQIEACLTSGAGCKVTSTDDAGHYSLGSLLLGTWTVRAMPPEPALGRRQSAVTPFTVSSDAPSATVDLLLPQVVPLLGGGGAGGGEADVRLVGIVDYTDDGVPVLYSKSPTTIKARGCVGGIGRAVVTVEGVKVAEIRLLSGRDIGPDGKVEYSGTLGALRTHGAGRISISIECRTTTKFEFDIYVDPSGLVRTTLGAPVPDATVTLLREDPPGAGFGAVANRSTVMSPANRKNPDKTRADGAFGWDVLTGRYNVRAEKAGCHKPGDRTTKFVETGPLDIPPAVLDVDLRLECPDKVAPKLSKLKVKGRTLTVAVSEAAAMKALFERCKAGRKAKCTKAKALKASAPYAQVFEIAVPKSVKAGRYRLTITAKDAAKNQAKPLTGKVTVK